MRTVCCFIAGVMADFAIPDDRFAEFSRHVPYKVQRAEAELHKARAVLLAFTERDSRTPAGPGEILAACFVWNYFNTHPEDEQHIEGDIIIVDLDGSGETIEYAAIGDVDVVPTAR
ncbi:MAG: hypothetical protein H7841_07770 [Magnetospirillum sp. WYHS-4]